MTEYEEICNGKTANELEAELVYQVNNLGCNITDSFPQHLIDEIEKLTNKSVRIIKFEGVDYWGRPVYKVNGLNVYIGDTETLWYGKSKTEIDNYYKQHLNALVIFGNTFDDGDPLGIKIKESIKLIII
jgi:hypothetical protein